jgi:hypothetical protein
LISANQSPGVVSAKLGKENVAVRIVGPFSYPHLPFSISVFLLWWLCLKRLQASFSLFTTYLFYEGRPSMTAFRLNYTTVSYSRVDDAIAIIKKLARGCFLAKTDMKSAVRIIPIRFKYWDHSGNFPPARNMTSFQRGIYSIRDCITYFSNPLSNPLIVSNSPENVRTLE